MQHWQTEISRGSREVATLSTGARARFRMRVYALGFRKVDRSGGPRRAFLAGSRCRMRRSSIVCVSDPLSLCLCLWDTASRGGSHDCPCEAGSVSLDGGVVEEGQSQLSRRRSLRHEADVCSRVFTWARRRRRGLRVRALGRSSEVRSASCSVRGYLPAECARWT